MLRGGKKMAQPKITIAGKVYEMPRLKGVAWRKLMEYEKNHSELFVEDFVEQRCEFLSELYGRQFSAADLLDNLYLEEIMRSYRESVGHIMEKISGSMAEAEKNVEKGGKKEQSE